LIENLSNRTFEELPYSIVTSSPFSDRDEEKHYNTDISDKEPVKAGMMKAF